MHRICKCGYDEYCFLCTASEKEIQEFDNRCWEEQLKWTEALHESLAKMNINKIVKDKE